MSEKVIYKGAELVIRGGAWNDVMNSCFYEVIDNVLGYRICREYEGGMLFALRNAR